MKTFSLGLGAILVLAQGCSTPCAGKGVFGYLQDNSAIEESVLGEYYLLVVGDDELTICPGEWSVSAWITNADTTLHVKGSGMGDTTVYAPDGADRPALHASGMDGAVISDLTLRGGGAELGGALESLLGDVRLERVHVTGATAFMGGGLYVREDTTLEVIDCIIDDNLARTAGGGAVVKDGGALISQGTQWGGAMANAPDDVALLHPDGWVADSIDLGEISSFECHLDGGVCE